MEIDSHIKSILHKYNLPFIELEAIEENVSKIIDIILEKIK